MLITGKSENKDIKQKLYYNPNFENSRFLAPWYIFPDPHNFPMNNSRGRVIRIKDKLFLKILMYSAEKAYTILYYHYLNLYFINI